MPNDLEKLQGHWNVTSLEVDGTAFPFAGVKIIIEGNKFASLAMGAAYTGIVKVDEGAVPKSFCMNFTDGPEKGNTNFGIYELNGDEWKICLTMSGGPAPKEFATKPGGGQALETLRRDGPNSQPEPG